MKKCIFNTCRHYTHEKKHRCDYFEEDRMYQCQTLRIDKLENQIKKAFAQIKARDAYMDKLENMLGDNGIYPDHEVNELNNAIIDADKAAKRVK